MAYHHGDARAALIRSARDLLERDGVLALSLRQTAERAGLSRQAPYNHFASKEALLAELIGIGFTDMTARMQADAAESPLERLTASAAGYLSFGMAHPALFRLMFGREHVDLCDYPTAQAAADRAFGCLRTIVASIATADAVDDIALVAWSLVHGYTSLCIERGLEPAAAIDRRAAMFAAIVADAAAKSHGRPER
jgi:AcrR family transcriptional regulator